MYEFCLEANGEAVVCCVADQERLEEGLWQVDVLAGAGQLGFGLEFEFEFELGSDHCCAIPKT